MWRQPAGGPLESRSVANACHLGQVTWLAWAPAIANPQECDDNQRGGLVEDTHLKTVQIESEIGSDGVLLLSVPLSTSDANTRVRVTIEPLEAQTEAEEADWATIVDQTYGSCAGLGLEEPPDPPPEQREWEQ